MREPLTIRDAGFFITDEGTGREDVGWALPSGPFATSVWRCVSIATDLMVSGCRLSMYWVMYKG